MKTVFGIDTEDLPTPALPNRPSRHQPLVYHLPYRFERGTLTFLWPEGSPWLVTHQVEERDEAIQHFCLRAFWSLHPSERVFALRIWQTAKPADLPETRTLMVTDEEIISLMLLEYSEGEAAYRMHHPPILPAGKCPAFEAFFPTMN